MYIDPEGAIVGVPNIEVRDFLYRANDSEWTRRYLADLLNLSQQRGAKLLAELLQLGYIEFTESRGKKRYFKRSLAGARFSLASAARPLTRKTAKQRLSEFLERVEAVNASDYYLYRVQKVLVFGSYLSDRNRINDIDVAVELVFREKDPKRREIVMQGRILEACKAGRKFSNIVEELFWPYQEVLLFLKSRSRAISLHTTDDKILSKVDSVVIFQDHNPDNASP